MAPGEKKNISEESSAKELGVAVDLKFGPLTGVDCVLWSLADQSSTKW